MEDPTWKKQLPPIVAAMLVLVILGIYVLVIGDPPDVVETGEKRLCPSRVFDQFDQSDWLAENYNRVNNTSSSNLWNPLFRELIPAVAQTTDDYLTMVSIQTVRADDFPNIKNTIQIKLRI